MLDQTQLLRIISGKRTGIFPTLIRGCLSCLTPIYRTAIGFRNRKFDRAIERDDCEVVRHASVPVISVGNLTTGGTGKTPLVIWIAKWLRKRDVRIALVSRGYGSQDGPNDEAREIEQRLFDVPHLQDPDRYKMSQIATEELETQVVVLDDGFQHRQLHRDLDVVLIDATCPFGHGRVLPRGLLREPIANLRRADVVILTRANLVSEEKKQKTIQKICSFTPREKIIETKTAVTKLLQSNGHEFELDELKEKPVFLFCAIGNPDGFLASAEQEHCNVAGSVYFPDHYEFSREDIVAIGRQAVACGAKAITCTHKDLVKISVNAIEGLPVYAILIEIDFISGIEALESALNGVCKLITEE